MIVIAVFFTIWMRPLAPYREDARAAGRDYISQTEAAVRAGHEARPDLTASEILAGAQQRRVARSCDQHTTSLMH